MKKVVLVYGLIAGAIVGGMMFLTMPLLTDGTIDFGKGELIGYSTMVIALSMVFFGVKSYRDNHLAGTITFGKGFQVGILITLLASVMYALSWEIVYSQIGERFMEMMNHHYELDMRVNGATEAEIQKSMEDMASFKELYQNPIIRFGMTLMEIFPVGLLITLVSAGLLRKKEFLPASR